MEGTLLHPKENYLVKINTATKLLLTLFFSVFIVFMKDENALLFLFLMSFLYVLPLKRFKVMFFGYAFISLMFATSMAFAALLGMIAERYGAKGSFVMLVPFLRVGFMVNLTLALTLSSGITKLVNILKVIRAPRVIFLPTIIVFRFIPSFINDIKQIHESIKIKLGSFNFITMITKPTLFIRLLIIPAVVRAIRSAEDLSAAAELKGISSAVKITNSAPEKFSFSDVLGITLALIVVLIAVVLNYGELS